MWSLLASHLIVKKRPNRVGNARRRRSSTITSGRPNFSNYGLIANKIMQKMGYDLENPVGLKNGKGLDEGTKEYIKREAIRFSTYGLGYIPEYGTRDGSEFEAYESSTTEG
ncbi:hypothetical protein V6N13_053606 [Hibiscus sabdariffa]